MRSGPHFKGAHAAGCFSAALVSSTLLLAGVAQAFTLGHSRLMSAPGSPLLLSVAVHNLTPAEIDSLTAQVPPVSAWVQAGLTPPVSLESMQVRVVQGHVPATRIIQVTSSNPFEGPVADLLLDIRTTVGQQRHQVSLLSQAGSTVRPAAVGGTSAAVRSGSRNDTPSSGSSVPVRRGDTLFAIARGNAVPGVTDYQFLVALYRANPQAFSQRNMNLLRAGSTLQIPEMAQLTAISDREARRIFRQHARAFAAYRQGLAASPGVAVDTGAVSGQATAADASDNGGTTKVSEPVVQPQVQAQGTIPSAETSQRDRLRLSGAGTNGASSAAFSGQGSMPADPATNATGVNTVASTVPGASAGPGVAAGTGAGAPASTASDASDQRIALERSMADAQGRVQELQANVHALQQLNETTQERAGPASGSGNTASSAGSEATPGQPSAGADPAAGAGAGAGAAQGDGSGSVSGAASSTGQSSPAVSTPAAVQSSSTPPTAVQSSVSPAAMSASIEQKADQTSSWLKDNMLAFGVALASLLVLLIAWLLRRRQAGRAAEQAAAQEVITEAMIREKLEQVDLDLDSPSNDRR